MDRTRHVLNELHVMAIGIEDIEPAVPILHGLELLRYFDALSLQIGVKLVDVGGLKRYVGETVLLGILELRKDFNVLMIVYFEICQQKPGSVLRQFVETEGFLKSQDAAVKFACSGNVIGAEPDMRNAHNRRTLRGRC